MTKSAQPDIPREREKENLSIEVTTHCNSACSHCFVRAALSKPSEMSVDLAKDILSEGYRLGYRRLHITGGEPLLWEGLFETLDSAFSLGYKKVLINTNGTLLTENDLSRFSDYDGLSISVSLQGPESLHDRMRGKDSHRRAMQGIEKALDKGIDLFIFTTVTKSLIPVLFHFADDLHETFPDIKCLTFIQLIRVKDDLFDLSKELLAPEDFLRLVYMVPLLNLNGHKTEILNNPLAAVVAKLAGVPLIPPTKPLHRDGHLIVLANGHITLSHSTHHSFGRYETGMIERALCSNGYQVAVAPDQTTCPSCGYSKLCKENKMIRPSEWYRDMVSGIPYCKRVLDRASNNPH